MDAVAHPNDHSNAPPEIMAELAILEEILGTKGEPAGSRASVPAHTEFDSDYDYVFYVPDFYELIGPEPNFAEPAYTEYLASAKNHQLIRTGWESKRIYTRQGSSCAKKVETGTRPVTLNAIVVTDKVEYDGWLAATARCRAEQVVDRQERIRIHREIIGDH